ncbi:MAG: hypothetical protein WCH37_09750 [Synechococcaceae cyanobacterium ELA182]
MKRPPLRLPQRRTGMALAVAAGVLCITSGLLAFRVFGFSHLSDSAVWSDHLDAVVAVFAQVRAGHTLLVDVPSQYGLYPEMLAPALSLLPSGLLGLTLAFAAIQLISLLSLMSVLRRRLHQPLVLLSALLALAMVTFGLHSLIGLRFSEPDPYFQYWPVRFVGPALSVPVTFWVFRHLSWKRLLTMSVFTGLCLFWNIDSGAAVLYGQCMLFLLLSGIAMARRHCGGWRWRRLALASLCTMLGSMLTLSMLVFLLSIKAGQPLQLAWLTSYQSTFYGLGLMMLPLPAWPDAWHSVLALYTMALIIGLVQILDGRPLSHHLPLLYLPLLGAGLFAYFQGRSHFFNLVSVCWPALLIAALLTDRHLLALKHRLVPKTSAALPAAGLAVLLIPSLALMHDCPGLMRRLQEAPIHHPDPSASPAPYLRTELEMVRRYCGALHPPCLILSKRQGIYALEAGSASDWKGPSPAELLLEADRQKLLHAINEGKPNFILLGLGDSALANLGITPAQLLPRYRPVMMNRDRTIALFVRRQAQAKPVPVSTTP